MNTADLKQELFLLTAYTLTSARGLYDEPADYGVFRLIDTAGRLLAIMESHDLLDPFLTRLKQVIDEEREGNMDDHHQRERLDQLILEIAHEIKNR